MFCPDVNFDQGSHSTAMRRRAILLAITSLVYSSPTSFSVNDDFFAFPQVGVFSFPVALRRLTLAPSTKSSFRTPTFLTQMLNLDYPLPALAYLQLQEQTVPRLLILKAPILRVLKYQEGALKAALGPHCRWIQNHMNTWS